MNIRYSDLADKKIRKAVLGALFLQEEVFATSESGESIKIDICDVYDYAPITGATYTVDSRGFIVNFERDAE